MNIYVGNLSFRMTEDEFRELFEEFGSVKSANIIKDRDSGRSKGFGFVEMENQEEAEKAIQELDGKAFQDRDIKVNQARPREERPDNNRRRY